MARRRSLTSSLYRAARASNNARAVTSGRPSKVARRGRNTIIGRAIGRSGIWR